MSLFEAALLGFIQGLTEFLPVSSSGHLVVAQNLLGLTEPDITFEVFLHFSTLLAIIVFFRKEIWNIRHNFSLLGALALGSVPAALVGFFLKDYIVLAFGSLLIVGVDLLITGIINLRSDSIMNKQKELENKGTHEPESRTSLTLWQGLLIGIFQAVAIAPGISRSGSTVFGSMSVGLNRNTAFTFSFLLAIPAILGATLLQVLEVYSQGFGQIQLGSLAIGGLVAMMSGFGSLSLLKYVMSKAHFQIFGWYCLLIGSLVIASSLL